MEVLFSDACEVARDHFQVFMEEMLGFDNTDFQNDLDDIMDNHELYKKIVISYPRGHGKSTHLSVGYPLYRIAKDHNLRILLISSTANISRSFLGEVMAHIERNENYNQFAQFCDSSRMGVVPKMKGYSKAKQNWSGSSLVIERSDLKMKDPTIQAVGVFGSILSKRADVIICDDVVNQENSQTEEQRQKVIDWIRTTVIPVLVPGGQFIYLGNTWHQADLVGNLMADAQFDYKNRVPAIKHESNHPELWKEYASILMDESIPLQTRKEDAQTFYEMNQEAMDDGVEVLWPERFPYKDLYMIRLSDGYAFERMYQCNANNRPNQMFKDEWIELACHKGRNMRLQQPMRTEFHTYMTTSGVDLAIGQEDYHDDTAITTIDKVERAPQNGDIKGGDIALRYVDYGHFTPNETRTKIKSTYDIIKPRGIRVESNGYQESIARDLNNEVPNIHSYHTGGEKFDSSMGVNGLANLMEIGKFILPFDQTDPYTVKTITRLANEMRAFPDGHTGDLLMSLWFAYSEMRDLTADTYMVPSTSVSTPQAVNSAKDLQDPVKRKEWEREADRQVESQDGRAEKLYEKQVFRNMMRPRR